MSELVKAPRSDLAITADQTFWTDKQAAALHQLGVANASNADLAVFFHQVTRTGLDPFLRQIYMIGREQSEKNNSGQWVKVVKQTIQTGIDGFRLIARRAADRTHESLGYEDTKWCGADGEWLQAWVKDEPPHAAAVVVLRNGQRFPAIGLYNEYVLLTKDNKPNRMWKQRPAGQLEKCVEALALRKAFPQDLSGIYTSDEMRESDAPQADWSAAAADQPPANVNPDTGEVIDAEVIEERIYPAQVKKMGLLMQSLGITDKASMLARAGTIVGYEVKDPGELTSAEGLAVIAALEADVVAT